MKGIFETKDQIENFTTPLNCLAKIMDSKESNGIVINASVADKSLSVASKHDSIGTMVHLNWKGLFDKFGFDKDETIGVLSIPQFVDYFAILEPANVELLFEAPGFSLTNTSGFVSFKTADADLIKQAPKTFKGTTWMAELEVTPAFNPLLRGISKIRTEDSVMVVGDSAKGEVVLSVSSPTAKLSTCKIVVKTPVAKDFESYFSKELFEQVLSTPSQTRKISFAERMMRVECVSKHYDMTYYVGKKVKV